MGPTGVTSKGATEWDKHGLVGRIVRVFVDDGVIMSEEAADHIEHTAEVLKRLLANGITLKASKCCFGANKITTLGHELTAGQGIKLDPDKIRAIMQTEPCRRVDALRAFIGTISWVSKSIPNHTALLQPLRKIANKYEAKSRINISSEWEESMAVDYLYK